MTKEVIQKMIDGNRDQINELLFHPNLEFVYIRIKMLSAQNKELIKKLKNEGNNN